MRGWNIIQNAEETPYDNSVSGLAADEVNTAIDLLNQFLGLVGGEYFKSESTQSTTSNGWTTKTTFTSSVLLAGDYFIDHQAEITNSDEGKDVGYRVQWRQGTSGTWNNICDVRDGVSVDNKYKLQSGFKSVTVSTDSVIQVRVQFGQTDEGGTGRIRNARVKIKRKG